MKPFLYAGIAAALLAGCQAPTWQKAGTSEALANEDAQACHAKARVTPSRYPPPPPSAYGAVAVLEAEDVRLRFERAEYRDCMAEKGYSAKH